MTGIVAYPISTTRQIEITAQLISRHSFMAQNEPGWIHNSVRINVDYLNRYVIYWIST